MTLPKHTDEWHRSWFGPFPFTAEAVSLHAPKRAGVYQIRRPNGGETLYVGISARTRLIRGELPIEDTYDEIEGASTIRSRLTSHVSGRGNKVLAELRRLGKLDGLEFVYFLCDGESARQIESFMTIHRKPSCNAKTEYRMYIPSISVH